MLNESSNSGDHHYYHQSHPPHVHHHMHYSIPPTTPHAIHLSIGVKKIEFKMREI